MTLSCKFSNILCKAGFSINVIYIDCRQHSKMAMLRALTFLLLVPIVFSRLRWRLLSPRNDSNGFPAARRDSSIGFIQAEKKLVVFGGKQGGKNFDDTWIYDLSNRKWEPVNPPAPVPQKRFSMVYGAFGKYFFISTGEYNGSPRQFFDDVWRFDSSSLSWRRLDENSETRPEQRYGSSGGIFNNGDENNGFYVTHGFSGRRYSNTFKFDLGKNEWQLKFTGSNNYNPNLPHARCLHSATMIKSDELLLYGGCLG